MTQQTLVRPRVVGIDISARGTGAVELRPDGSVGRILFFTDERAEAAKWADTHNVRALHSPDVPSTDQSGVWARTVRTAETIVGFVSACAPQAVAIEEFPYGVKGGNARQLYDLHALVRYGLSAGGLAFKDDPRPIRYYNVSDIKLCATGSGKAEKEDMVAAAEMAGFPASRFASYVTRGPKKGQRKDGGPDEDLADAFWVASLLQLEVCLRSGQVALDELGPDARRVFQKKPPPKPRAPKPGKPTKRPKPKVPDYHERPFLLLTEPLL